MSSAQAERAPYAAGLEDFVVWAFHDRGVCFRRVDGVQRICVANEDRVGHVAYEVAVFLVQPPHVKVGVAFPGVICAVAMGEASENWAREFGQWVEEEEVNDSSKDLLRC